ILQADSFNCSRHCKTHSRPYVCDVCDRGFGLRSDLARHKAQHERVNTRFYCKWPDCKFTGTCRRDNLRKHMRNAHKMKKKEGQQVVQDEAQVFYEESIKEQKRWVDCISILLAVEKGEYSVVQLLLDKGADITTKSDAGKTALHIAAINGNEELVR